MLSAMKKNNTVSRHFLISGTEIPLSAVFFAFVLAVVVIPFSLVSKAFAAQVSEQTSDITTISPSTSSLESVLNDWEGPYHDFLLDFYAENGYQHAWNNTDNVTEALTLLSAVTEDGLEPEYFHYSHILALKRADDRDAFDIQLTESIVALATALRYGVLDQEKFIEGGISARKPLPDPEQKLLKALRSGTLTETILAQRPALHIYEKLLQTLRKYRQLATREPLAQIALGSTLKKGDSGERVTQLIARLHNQGYLGVEPLPVVFNASVEEAVKAMQAEHEITPDGIAGEDTLRLLNTTPAQRIDKLRANLERVRWLGNIPSKRMVLVNIPRYQVEVLDDGEVSWQGPVIVGAEYTETPPFKDELRYIEFNPTWTVPRSIIRRSLAKKIIDNPKYLQEKHFYLAKSSGQEVDPATVDWSSLTPSNFPYWVVQKPGEHNALGRVKFMFPNKYSVYMHDTPNKALFDKTQRTFSHGCIRVENPLDLAAFLLKSQGWDKARIDEVIASKETTRASLETSIPIIIGYWTVDYEGDEVRFLNDVYERDAKLIAALKSIQ